MTGPDQGPASARGPRPATSARSARSAGGAGGAGGAQPDRGAADAGPEPAAGFAAGEPGLASAAPEAAAGSAPAAAQVARLTAWVEGRVQGVGFRWWTRVRALELGLTGVAENLTDGRVKVVAEGPRSRCTELLELLEGGQARRPGPARDHPLGPGARRSGRFRRALTRWGPALGGLAGFAER